MHILLRRLWLVRCHGRSQDPAGVPHSPARHSSRGLTGPMRTEGDGLYPVEIPLARDRP
jgi:hypothetical protein